MKYLFLPFAIFITIFFSGCYVPVIYLIKACQYNKDVSDDPRRGYIVGKEFLLKDDVFLYKYCDSDELHIDKGNPKIRTLDRNGNNVSLLEDPDITPFCDVIKSGTKLTITKVLVKTQLSEEMSIQYIHAQFIYREQLITANASGLFKNTSNSPNEEWYFIPIPELIVEVKPNEDSELNQAKVPSELD